MPSMVEGSSDLCAIAGQSVLPYPSTTLRAVPLPMLRIARIGE